MSSTELSDDEFVGAFESCALPNTAFRHRDHLRLAWVSLRRVPYDLAASAMEQGIRRFAAYHGSPDKYHHTLTMVWMRLVAAAAADGGSDDSDDFGAFLAAHPTLLDKTAPERFYSVLRLGSREARTAWLDPDLSPLPQVGARPEAARDLEPG